MLTPFDSSRRLGRNAAVVAGVLTVHIALLWVAHAGMTNTGAKPSEIIIPAQLLGQFVSTPALAPTPAAPTPRMPPPAPTLPKPRLAPPIPKVVPLPMAIENPAPAPDAPAGALEEEAAPAPPALPSAPVAASTEAAAPNAEAPHIELPSSDAAYLNNPPPPYPEASRRLREKGKVTLRVLISAQGLPKKMEIAQSSGFARLDNAALDTVKRWKFVPGKRNGVPEAMEYLVPVNFVLHR